MLRTFDKITNTINSNNTVSPYKKASEKITCALENNCRLNYEPGLVHTKCRDPSMIN